MLKIEIGARYWTTCPTLHDAVDKGLDAVPPWEGQVVKVIGGSIWLAVLEADAQDVMCGTRTCIARPDQLFLSVTDALKNKPAFITSMAQIMEEDRA